MKILFVINSLAEKSGTERVACLLANSLRSYSNAEIIIINRESDNSNVAYDLDNNIKVKPIKGNYLDFFIGLKKNIIEYQPNIIITHNMGRLSLLTSFLKVKDVKMITLEHVAFSKRPIWVQLLSKMSYKKFNDVICLTSNDKKSFENFHNSVSVINNISPFDFSEYPYNYDINSKTIIAIGRLTYQKNFLSLLKAWKIVVERDKSINWNLKIYGKGEEFNILQAFINDHHLKNVTLMGEVDDVVDVYRQASFFVMSSRFEGLPMVLIEAQSFGLPIVSFDCPHGPREIIEDKINGYIVEDQDINMLAERILKLINNPKIRQQFSFSAYQHAKIYSKSNIINKWLNLIQ